MAQAPQSKPLTDLASGPVSRISKNWLVAPDSATVQERAQKRLERIEQERLDAAAERRAGRLKGHLSKALHENLRNCNPLQLKTVRRLVAKYEKDHRTPPSLSDCRQKQTIEILAHKDVYNRRYTLELQRSSRNRSKVYVNGPYVVVHHRNGNIIQHEYIGNKKLSTRLPRTIWPVFRPFMTSPEILARIEKHNRAWDERANGG